jgi:hypothetical protein
VLSDSTNRRHGKTKKISKTIIDLKKNKKTCGPIFSKEERIALLGGFQKQNTYIKIADYAKANNVSKSNLRDWQRTNAM